MRNPIKNLLNSALSQLGKKEAEFVEERARVGATAVLEQLERVFPAGVDLAAGRKVILHTKTEMWIEENPVDGPAKG